VAQKLSDLPKAYQSAILAVLGVILAGAVFWYFVWPLSAQVDALRRDLQGLHAQNLRNKSFEQEHTSYVKRIAESQKQLEALRSTVPEEPATDEFVKMVHDAAVASAVHLRTFAAQPPVAQEMYTETPFKVRLDGTYYALLSFFSRLAQGQRIVGVTGLALGPAQGGGQGKYAVQHDETVGANCVLMTYYSGSQTPPAAKPR